MNNPQTPPPSSEDPKSPPLQYPSMPGIGYPIGGYPGMVESGPPEDHSILGEFTIPRLIHILKRKWYILILLATLFGTTGYYYIQRIDPVYRASASFEVRLRGPRIVKSDAVFDPSASTREGFKTFVIKLKASKRIKETVAQVLKENPNYSGDKAAQALSAGAVSFDPVSQSFILNVAVRHGDPVVAADIANAYVEAISRVTFEDNRASSDGAVAWLKSQADTLRDTLEKSDEELLRFQQASDLFTIQAQKENLDTSIQNISQEKLTIESRITVQQEAMTLLSNTELTPETLDSIPEDILKSSTLSGALQKLRTARSQRSALLVRYTPKHPEVLGVDEIIDTLTQELEQAIVDAQASAKTNLSLLGKQLQTLTQRQETLSKARDETNLRLVKAQMTLSRLERAREASDISYKGILKRIEEARLAADESSALVTGLTAATVPSLPVEPNPRAIMQTAILSGLFLGLLLAFVSDKLDDFIWTATDLEKGLGLRIIGLLPRMKVTKRESLAKYSAEKPSSIFAESFAGARNSLISGSNKNTRVLLVSSSNPQEGKTVSSTNLAIAYAHAGKRTLLVDLDMRIPRLQRVFDLENDIEKNLVYVLSRKEGADFSVLPQGTEVENLFLATSSPLTDVKPGQILGSKVMGEFVQWARENFDQVILDSPPFGLVSDTTVLASLADGVVIVARERKSRKAVLRRGLMNFNDCGANILGVIVNDIHFRDRKYNYYSPYAHHHSYYYDGGYGDRQRSERA